MDGVYMFTKFNAKRYRQLRKSCIRLTLRTEDIASIFSVKLDTVRHWIHQNKLVLTEDPIKSYLELTRLYLRYLQDNNSSLEKEIELRYKIEESQTYLDDTQINLDDTQTYLGCTEGCTEDNLDDTKINLDDIEDQTKNNLSDTSY